MGDKEFTALMGRCIGMIVVRVFAQVEGWLEWVIEALDIDCFWNHDA